MHHIAEIRVYTTDGVKLTKDIIRGEGTQDEHCEWRWHTFAVSIFNSFFRIYIVLYSFLSKERKSC